MTKHLHIVEPVGFCGSVRRALEIFRNLCTEHPGEPIYVLHELVHNASVSAEMRSSGAVFVKDINEVPEGALVLLGAHGHGPSVDEACLRRHLRVTDATCPLVASLHQRMLAVPPEVPIVFLGDANHAEVVGVMDSLRGRLVYQIASASEVESLPEMSTAAVFCQTTQSIPDIQRVLDALVYRVEHPEYYESQCKAVVRRQQLLIEASVECDTMIVVGSHHSANAGRLARLAQLYCTDNPIWIEQAEEVREEMLVGVEELGIASATSTPDDVFQKVVERLVTMGFIPQKQVSCLPLSPLDIE